MSDDDSFRNELPPEVQSWVEDYPEADAETLGKVWQLSGRVPPAMDPDPEHVAALRSALRNATATDHSRNDTASSSAASLPATSRTDDRAFGARTRRFRRWVGWATRAILLVLLAVGVYTFAVPARISVPAGQTQTLTLADGSRIELNSSTTLQYPRWWSVGVLRSWLGRSVHLEGEAFFSVTETGTPFRVETDNAEVRVLGTQFNVRARRTDGRPETRVVVAEGRIALTAASATTRLDSAQAARVQGEGPPSPSKEVRLVQALAWREGGFFFSETSVRAIGAELERRYNVPITVQPNVGDRLVTLTVRDSKGPVTLLRDICRVAGCRVDSTNSGLTIVPR